MPLPRLPPLRRAHLVRFDLTSGMTAAVVALRRHLSRIDTARALMAMAWRAGRDPLADIPAGDWPPHQEELTRHQLRSAFHLDDIARDVLLLPDDARMALLADAIAETGARFVATLAPTPDLARWRGASPAERLRYAQGVAGRLINARVEVVAVEDDRVDLDVTACRFVELCRAAGRPYLAPLFCEADSRHFESDRTPLRLLRTGTIANGSSRCDFRFRYR